MAIQALNIYTEDMFTEQPREVRADLLEWQLLTNDLPIESKEYAVSTFDDTVFLATYDTDKEDFDSYFPVVHWAEIV
tara:strand:- start:202 stop:432 length:231 start_codon:yes stop_codon:yes gene_type:complete